MRKEFAVIAITSFSWRLAKVRMPVRDRRIRSLKSFAHRAGASSASWRSSAKEQRRENTAGTKWKSRASEAPQTEFFRSVTRTRTDKAGSAGIATLVIGADRVQGGGWVGCRIPGQNQMTRRSNTLAPRPTTWAKPKWPSFQASQANKITMPSIMIRPVRTILCANIAANPDFECKDRQAGFRNRQTGPTVLIHINTVFRGAGTEA